MIISLNIKYFAIKMLQLGFFCLSLHPNIDIIRIKYAHEESFLDCFGLVVVGSNVM